MLNHPASWDRTAQVGLQDCCRGSLLSSPKGESKEKAKSTKSGWSPSSSKGSVSFKKNGESRTAEVKSFT